MPRNPEREESLVAAPGTTPWDVARERLANPEHQWTNWLATMRPDGRPHVMPVIAVWVDDAFHFIAGEGTQKARNLAADDRCVIAIASRTLPSMDIVVEGRAQPLSDENEVLRMADVFRSNNWPLDVRGTEVFGPNAPTAGPPPYRIFRMVPTKAFGLPGTYGMDKFDPEDLPKPTRWDFAEG
ncbi:MAG TPA: pyridoxamine 5'-phosphate oxidase family protein [Candidatus Limnocylindrales bacterium]|nr:pyridoxamine 5'-phosphate oxidase family protein [Candidatus Limnocylindrales bacterium]